MFEESDKYFRTQLELKLKKELRKSQNEDLSFNQTDTTPFVYDTNEPDDIFKIIQVEVNSDNIISECTYNNEDDQDCNNPTEHNEQIENYDVVVPSEIINNLKHEDVSNNNENDLLYNSKNQINVVNNSISKRLTHLNQDYEDITKYECNICGESHMYAFGFQQHMKLKHQLLDVDCNKYATLIQVQKISFINKKFNLDQETNVNYNDASYNCKYCTKQFKYLSQLQQHLKVHVNRKYICEVCGASFTRKTYLDDHMEGHSNERKHICKFCGKAFRRRTVLRAHKRVHTHPNYYVCELCGKGFTNISTLKTHKLLIHIKERKFTCLICNLKFPLKSTLNKHVFRHQKRENGEKDFGCDKCQMKYKDKCSLKRHIETKHEGRVVLIKCEDCPKKYTSKANLVKHRNKNHPTVTNNAS